MDVQMPSTSTQNRFCDAYKSTFLKQVYNRELKCVVVRRGAPVLCSCGPLAPGANTHPARCALARLAAWPVQALTRLVHVVSAPCCALSLRVDYRRFDPAKLPLHSHKMQRRLRRVRVMPNGDIVGRPRTAVVFSPVKKYPSTSDLCRPVGIDGYRRTLALPPSPVRQSVLVVWQRRSPRPSHSWFHGAIPQERPAKLGGTLARPPQFDAESTLNMLERYA